MMSSLPAIIEAHARAFRLPSQWLEVFADIDAVLHCRGEVLLLDQDLRQICIETIHIWEERFGAAPMALVHSPGRINLRGMHIDTHGGWLNLMTHQRAVVLAIGPNEEASIEACNADPRHRPLRCSWDDPKAVGDGWERYLLGGLAAIRDSKAFSVTRGVRAVFHGNIPQGASLSSSAALCLAWLCGLALLEAHDWDVAALILAARQAEWHAGARTGTGDQAAIVLGRANAVLHTTLLAEDFRLDHCSWISFPAHWRLLVIESGASRQLSGAARVAYGRNRFAYSAALELFRRAWKACGAPAEMVDRCDRLSTMNLDSVGGASGFWSILMKVPEQCDLHELRAMALPGLEETYQKLFGDVPAREQPRRFPIRAPLLYGLAESRRASLFPEWLRQDDLMQAGKAMSIGHDGDRVVTATDEEWAPDYSDAALREIAAKAVPVEWVSGYYGASSPAMDRLCDAATAAGAAGACLTGAGIAGAVLALCSSDTVDAVREAVVALLQSSAYGSGAGLGSPIPSEDAEEMVVEQRAVPGVGAIIPR